MKKIISFIICISLIFCFAGCKKRRDTSSLNCRNIVETIKNSYGSSYAPNTEIPDEVLSTDFGLVLSDIEDYYGEMPQIGYASDRIVAVKAVHNKTDAVVECFENAKKDFLKDDMQYSNTAKVNSAVILQEGDFVCFFMLGDNYQDTKIGEEETEEESEFYKEQIQIGVDAWNQLFYEN